MNSFTFLGTGTRMYRTYIPRCPSCVRHSWISRSCDLCSGTGYFVGCDNCEAELIAHDAVCWRVERGDGSKLWCCDKDSCVKAFMEEACPIREREEESDEDMAFYGWPRPIYTARRAS